MSKRRRQTRSFTGLAGSPSGPLGRVVCATEQARAVSTGQADRPDQVVEGCEGRRQLHGPQVTLVGGQAEFQTAPYSVPQTLATPDEEQAVIENGCRAIG